MLTNRDIPVLDNLARYFVMTRRQISRLCLPNDSDGRITRRRLNVLLREKFVNRQKMLMVNPVDGSPTPVYVLGNAGRRFLAEHFEDDRYLLKPVNIAQPQHLFHHIAVTETHMAFDQAIAMQENVTLLKWTNEQDIVNDEEPDPKKHFKLFTELRSHPRRLVCAPDAGFMLDCKGHRGVFYLEQDRGHNRYDHTRVAARKTPGYTELYRKQLHRTKHFPDTTLDHFTVLIVTDHPKRRDALRRAFGKEREAAKNVGELINPWRFACTADVTPESFLHGAIWYRFDGDEPDAMVKL